MPATPALAEPGPLLRTPRLVLRRFEDSDLAEFLAYRNDPEVSLYQSWDCTSEAEGRAFVAEQKPVGTPVTGQWFQLAIAERATGALAGDCGIEIARDDPLRGEIGFTLGRAHQGKGIASEAIATLIDWAVLDLGLHRIVATVDPANAQSIALLERLGLRREAHYVRNIWFKGRWDDEYLYAVLRDEWLARRDLRQAASYAVRPMLDQPDGPIWHGLSGSGALVGCARARADDGLATLAELWVDAAHARFGLAAQLLRAVLGWSQTTARATLRVDPAAIAQLPAPLLDRLGFLVSRMDGACIMASGS